MARYYRRRYSRTIIRAPKKKWASNLTPLTGEPIFGTNNTFVFRTTLSENKTETNAPTPIVIKTGNFKVQFDMVINVNSSGSVGARAFVLFVPQGMLTNPDNDTFYNVQDVIFNHPEWIMAWRELDFGNANSSGSVDTSVVKFSSRMKRNLNSGDRIMFFILGTGDFTGITSKANVSGMVQYWSCAN